MNRRNRTLIVLAVAVVLASIASYVVYRAISRMPVREVEVATVHVAVAAENLPMGTRLAKEHIKVVGWPAGSPVDGAFATADDVLNRGLIQTVYQNEPITEGKLAPIEAGAGLPPSITPGMRALSVRVNEVIGVAGFTVPGTRVDVLVTLKDGDNSLTGGLILAASLVGTNSIVGWLTYRFKPIEAWLDGRPMILVRDGKIDHDLLKQAQMSVHELQAALRHAGHVGTGKVRFAILENTGKISVISKADDETAESK